AAGAVDVVVTNAAGSDTLTDGITYVEASDNIVKLVKGGSVVGDDKSSGSWPIELAPELYGGPTDLWGTSLTPAEVNASDFGVVLSATVGSDAVAYVAHIQIKVFYSTPGLQEGTPLVSVLTVGSD